MEFFYSLVKHNRENALKALISIIVFLNFSISVLASDSLPEVDLEQKAEEFIYAKNSRQQPDSTEDDIDYFISLLADDFIDEHVKFDVTVTEKAELRKGMIGKLQDKVYFSEIHIEQLMFGRNVVFIKYTEHAKVKPFHLSEVIEYTSTNIISLEFNESGLIKHIRRHHG